MGLYGKRFSSSTQVMGHLHWGQGYVPTSFSSMRGTPQFCHFMLERRRDGGNPWLEDVGLRCACACSIAVPGVLPAVPPSPHGWQLP